MCPAFQADDLIASLLVFLLESSVFPFGGMLKLSFLFHHFLAFPGH